LWSVYTHLGHRPWWRPPSLNSSPLFWAKGSHLALHVSRSPVVLPWRRCPWWGELRGRSATLLSLRRGLPRSSGSHRQLIDLRGRNFRRFSRRLGWPGPLLHIGEIPGRALRWGGGGGRFPLGKRDLLFIVEVPFGWGSRRTLKVGLFRLRHSPSCFEVVL
jgi:hypothetical protein